jgi:hypothetical protein
VVTNHEPQLLHGEYVPTAELSLPPQWDLSAAEAWALGSDDIEAA